jgi:hypothetical protein
MITTSRAFLAWIGVVDVLLLAVSTFAARYGVPWLGIRADLAFLMFAVAAIGIITFFGLLLLSHRTTGAPLEDQGLRLSITVAVITVYLVVVGEAAFWATTTTPSPITDTVLTSFTSIVGVVIAFFFGSSAYVEVKKRDEGKSAS